MRTLLLVSILAVAIAGSVNAQNTVYRNPSRVEPLTIMIDSTVFSLFARKDTSLNRWNNLPNNDDVLYLGMNSKHSTSYKPDMQSLVLSFESDYFENTRNFMEFNLDAIGKEGNEHRIIHTKVYRESGIGQLFEVNTDYITFRNFNKSYMEIAPNGVQIRSGIRYTSTPAEPREDYLLLDWDMSGYFFFDATGRDNMKIRFAGNNVNQEIRFYVLTDREVHVTFDRLEDGSTIYWKDGKEASSIPANVIAEYHISHVIVSLKKRVYIARLNAVYQQP